MALRKARKSGSSRKAKAARKAPARAQKAGPKTAAKAAIEPAAAKSGASIVTALAAANKRIATLEAENRRLRDEIGRLRTERAAADTSAQASEGPPTLEL